MVPFPVTLSDRLPRFQGHGAIVDALDILCAQLARDLFAIAKFLYDSWLVASRSCKRDNDALLDALFDDTRAVLHAQTVHALLLYTQTRFTSPCTTAQCHTEMGVMKI